MLTTMKKKVGRQELIIHGHLLAREVYELKREGWRLVWRDKPVKRLKGAV